MDFLKNFSKGLIRLNGDFLEDYPGYNRVFLFKNLSGPNSKIFIDFL